MALVNGPLFSLEASGQLGRAIVYSKWKGRAYVREYVVPANPRTIDQVIQRGNLGALSKWWAGLPDDPNAQSSWDALAAAKSISPFNAMLSYNLEQLRDNQAPIGHLDGGAAEGAGIESTTVLPLGSGKVNVQVSLDAAPNASDILLFAIGTDGGANTTANSFQRVIDAVSNSVSAAPVFEVSNIPPGAYFFSARLIGTDGNPTDVWTPTAAAVTVT